LVLALLGPVSFSVKVWRFCHHFHPHDYSVKEAKPELMSSGFCSNQVKSLKTSGNSSLPSYSSVSSPSRCLKTLLCADYLFSGQWWRKQAASLGCDMSCERKVQGARMEEESKSPWASVLSLFDGQTLRGCVITASVGGDVGCHGLLWAVVGV
jgi:hypothetical protein